MAPMLLSAALAAVSPTGTLAPEVDVQPVATCQLNATAVSDGQAFLSQPGPTRLELPPGAYDAQVRCETRPGVLAAELGRVVIRAGQIHRPRVHLRPARLRVLTRRRGELRPATVRIFSAGARAEAPLYQAPANRKLTLAAGRYDVEVSMPLEGQPDLELRRRGLWVGDGRVTQVELDFEDGELVVDVRNNGAPADAVVRLFRPGDSVSVAQASEGQLLHLVPGRYRAEVALDGSASFDLRTEEVWVTPERRTRLPVRFQTGTLEVSVTSDGAPAAAVVHLERASTGAELSPVEVPSTLTLAPDVYALVIRTDPPIYGRERHSTPAVTVRAGHLSRVQLDLTPAWLHVEAPPEARIRVVPEGDDAAPEGPEHDGAYRLWPGRYRLVATFPDGRTLEDGPFEVSTGQRLTRRLTPHLRPPASKTDPD